MGNRLTETVPLDDTTNAVTRYAYDAFGAVVKVTDPNNNASYSYYDKLGRLTLAIDAENYATQTSYSPIGDIASTKRYYTKATNTGSTTTLPTLTANPKDATTRFFYDKLGRVTKTTDAEGHYEQYTLNRFGDRTQVRNKLGGITTNLFDKIGRLVQETLPVGSTRSDGTVQSPNIINTFAYDSRGNLVKKTEALGLSEQRTTTYEYDKIDRLIQKTGDNFSVLDANTINTPVSAVVESYQYDRRDNLILVIDPTGAKTFSYYDDNDRKRAQISPVGTLTTWDYDGNGNPHVVRVYDNPVSLPSAAGGSTPTVPGGVYRETIYEYYANDMLLTSTENNVLLGYYNGSYYSTGTRSVTVFTFRDAMGNIVRQVDGGGAAVYYYYDKLGRKIAQLDEERFLTAWALDGDGNVLTEIRYATKYNQTPVEGGSSPMVSADATNDRITAFTYDKNGRRLNEIRKNVLASTVSASGALSQSVRDVTISYSYNGLGLVTAKSYDNGDVTSYYHDVMGRQTAAYGPVYIRSGGDLVQNWVANGYDGLNNVTRTVENAVRTTTYEYGAGGRLFKQTDASGFSTHFWYDAAGRVTGQMYQRVKADGSSQAETKAFRYDAAGRLISQATALNTAANVWQFFGDTIHTAYTTQGEVRARGVNGTLPENMSYDASGRVWRSTAGDGVVKLFIYDAKGRVTLTITSNGGALPSGYSWATITLSQAINLLTNNGNSTIGAVSVPGMIVTVNAYSDRGLLLQTLEPLRETNAVGSSYTTIVHSRSYNAFGEVVSETNARGFTTNFSYNTMGRLIQKLSPNVDWTAENGAVASVRPQEDYYYDALGRLVGMRDANGNLQARTLLAGSGMDGEEALVLKEFRADGSVLEKQYDVFRDMRVQIDERGWASYYDYDNMGRLTQLTHAPGVAGVRLVDYYSYDGLRVVGI